MIFGSEIKAILQDPSVKKEFDYEAFNSFLTFRYNPSPQTLLKNVGNEWVDYLSIHKYLPGLWTTLVRFNRPRNERLYHALMASPVTFEDLINKKCVRLSKGGLAERAFIVETLADGFWDVVFDEDFIK